MSETFPTANWRLHERDPAFRASLRLVAVVRRLTAALPDDEKSHLSSAMRKAVDAVPWAVRQALQAESPDELDAAVRDADRSLAQLDVSLRMARSLGYVSSSMLRSARRRLDPLSRQLVQLRDDRVAA